MTETKRFCPKCGGIMILNRSLHFWECGGCRRRLGAWITGKKTAVSGVQ